MATIHKGIWRIDREYFSIYKQKEYRLLSEWRVSLITVYEFPSHSVIIFNIWWTAEILRVHPSELKDHLKELVSFKGRQDHFEVYLDCVYKFLVDTKRIEPVEGVSKAPLINAYIKKLRPIHIDRKL